MAQGYCWVREADGSRAFADSHLVGEGEVDAVIDRYPEVSLLALQLLKQAIPAPAPAVPPAVAGQWPRMTKEEANKEAIRLARLDRTFVHKPLREWAEAIGCSEGLVPKLPLWQQTMKQSGRGRKDKPNRPKKVALTDEILAKHGQEDEALQHLIEDHQKDAEPSPLEDDPPDRPYKVWAPKEL
jgi:hypothetical protein